MNTQKYTQKAIDGFQVSKWPDGPRDKQHTLCPQFRACDLERPYPVRGHCILAQSPGWFMIPSIEEYARYCTSAEFSRCCWFRRAGETVGALADMSG